MPGCANCFTASKTSAARLRRWGSWICCRLMAKRRSTCRFDQWCNRYQHALLRLSLPACLWGLVFLPPIAYESRTITTCCCSLLAVFTPQTNLGVSIYEIMGVSQQFNWIHSHALTLLAMNLGLGAPRRRIGVELIHTNNVFISIPLRFIILVIYILCTLIGHGVMDRVMCKVQKQQAFFIYFVPIYCRYLIL